MKVANTDIRQDRRALHEANGGRFPLTSAKTAMHFTKQTEALQTVTTAQASTALKEILITSPCKFFLAHNQKGHSPLGIWKEG